MGDGTDITITTADGYSLAASHFSSRETNGRVVVISSAMATPRRYYQHYAAALAELGYEVLTYDYRGIGDSSPPSLRGFDADIIQWAELDMTGVLDWARARYPGYSISLVGHSLGGQIAGLIDDRSEINGMLTLSSQSGYWRLQGAEQKIAVLFYAYVVLPGLAHLFGYVPWSRFGSSEDLPSGAVLQWARWCRDKNYLLGDESLPLERYGRFDMPVLAYSIDDDKWGTARAVDAMMSAYPKVERRHFVPSQNGLASIGHFGFFRRKSESLWPETFDWLAGLSAS